MSASYAGPPDCLQAPGPGAAETLPHLYPQRTHHRGNVLPLRLGGSRLCGEGRSRPGHQAQRGGSGRANLRARYPSTAREVLQPPPRQQAVRDRARRLAIPRLRGPGEGAHGKRTSTQGVDPTRYFPTHRDITDPTSLVGGARRPRDHQGQANSCGGSSTAAS